MNINEIYQEHKCFLEKQVSDTYNKFVKIIEKDDDYTLSDDELSELFNEILLMYLKDSISSYEWNRITK